MRFFVTGFDGYVGSHAVTALRAKGAVLSVLVRDDAQASSAEAAGLVPVRANLEKPETLGDAVRSVDGVGHFAASDRPEFLSVNRAAIATMLKGLPQGAAFLTHSGTMVFGEQGRTAPATAPEFAPPSPLSGRAELDKAILAEGDRGRLRTYVVYGALVFGGRGAIIPNALVKAARGAGFSAYPGDGRVVWSAVHVEDWAELMALALVQGPPGGHAVIASAQDVTIADAASMAGTAFSPPLAPRSVHLDEGRKLWPFFADGFTLYQRFSGAPAGDMFGWKPLPRDLEAAFREVATQ